MPFQSKLSTGSYSDKFGDGEVSHAALEPQSFFFPGVCLLVDISGFTRLSGEFCALGKEGIDSLQQATNGYMGKLVEVIYQHGGDIIKFAGDAIICIFVERDVRERLRMGIDCRSGVLSSEGVNRFSASDNQCSVSVSVCKQAMVCAMSLREMCNSHLTVHVALSCGEMCFGIVGGHSDKFECLISGPCLMELSQCLDDTKSKEVASSASFADVVGTDVLTDFGGLKMASGNYLLRCMPSHNLPPLQAESAEEEEAVVDYVIMSSKPEYVRLVNMFVPLPVSLAFESGGLKYLAEIREVTTMFMKWESYNVESNRDIITLQTPFVQIQAIIAQQGGFIRQFLIDDKGCVLIACWGVHTASYLNNATRALASAVLIRDLFQSKTLLCSIGITTGNVYCGNVGNEIRREYAAIGDTVNLSARLMSSAKGGILIDYSTHSHLAVDVWKRFTALDPMQVKGKTLPIQAYSFEATSGVSDVIASAQETGIEEHEIKLSCRTTLLKLLERQIKRTVNREVAPNVEVQSLKLGSDMCDIVYLEGRVGSGKATTVKWFVREAKRRDIRVIRVSNIEPQDMLLEYKALSKLLVECIGHNVVLDGNKQRLVIMHILKAIYGDDNSGSQRNSGPVDNKVHSSGSARSSANTTMHHSNPNSTSYHYPIMSNKLMNGNDYIDRVALPVLRMVLGNMISTNTPLFALDSMRYGLGEKVDRSSMYNTTNKRIPIKLVCDTIRDMISFYLSEEPTIIVIENVHYADENSLKVLACLRDAPAQGVLLMTSLSADDMFVDYARTRHCRSSISRKDMMHRDGEGTALTSAMRKSLSDALDNFKTMIGQSIRTHYVRVDEFNLSEIDGMICNALNINNVPLGLAQWVQSLSGGSIYWINEMLEFIKSTGIESFMSITATQHSPHRMKAVQRHSSSIQRHSSAHSLHNSDSDKTSAPPLVDGLSNSAMTETSRLYAPVGGLPSPLPYHQYTSRNSPTAHGKLRSFPVDHDICVQEAKFSQLQHFIVSRFERLPLDDQRILKKASVIGFDFSRYVLYGILAPGLKPHLHMALKNLVKEKWILKVNYSDPSRRTTIAINGAISGQDAEYVFAHAMAWDTLYNLTPPGDRKEIHRMVANYYGNMGNSEDAALYDRISFHYSHCDEQRAFEYATKAAAMYLMPPNASLQNSICVLIDAIKLVQTVTDLKALSSVLEACKGYFNADYGPYVIQDDSAIGSHGMSVLSRNVSFNERIAPRQMKSFFSWFSCIRNNAVAPAISSVHTATSSIERRVNAKSARRIISKFNLLGQGSGNSSMVESNRSSISNISHLSVQLLNEMGRDYMLRILSYLEKQVEKRYAELVMADKTGNLHRWHKEIIRDLRMVDRDYGSETQRSRGCSK
ncbi:hypothetical protein EON65_22970 [archaeon]|nr:MAG: hypothetical protein EON65_22970 [archaeon]